VVLYAQEWNGTRDRKMAKMLRQHMFSGIIWDICFLEATYTTSPAVDVWIHSLNHGRYLLTLDTRNVMLETMFHPLDSFSPHLTFQRP
jgi:hypothetical protein